MAHITDALTERLPSFLARKALFKVSFRKIAMAGSKNTKFLDSFPKTSWPQLATVGHTLTFKTVIWEDQGQQFTNGCSIPNHVD